MAGDIVVTGLAENDPVPGVYLETNFAQGPAAGSSGQRAALLIGNKLSTGAATVDTVIYGADTPVPCTTEADVISLFGQGSPLHRAYRRFTKINQVTPLYLLAVTESAGTAASLTITITNAATGNGNIRVMFDELAAECAVTSGDSANSIATNLATKINEKADWPFTASPSTNTVVLTMKVKGPRGNFGRIQCLITSGIGTTISQTADTAFSGGATADSNTTALSTILAKRFDYIISEAEDATQFGALLTQVNLQAAPTTGIRQACFAGSVDTVANTITIATGRNGARAELVWSYKSPWSPFELAAHNAAIYSLFEASSRPRTNFAGFGTDEQSQTYWHVPPPRDVTAHPTRAQLVSALNNGITPIAVDSRGKTYLVNRITTKSLTGAVADYRIRDAHKRMVCDRFADSVHAKTVLQFSGRKISGDPPQGKAPPGADFVWPQLYKSTVVFQLIDDFNDNGMLDPDKVAAAKAGTVVQRGTSPTTRMGVRVPLPTVDNALQFAVAIDQVA